MAIRDLGLPPQEPGKPYLVPLRKPGRARKIIAWIAGIIAALVIVLAVGIYAVLHTAFAHNYILKTAQGGASEALNTRVTLQDYGLHLSTFGLDLYGLTVYGVGPGANAPLLQVDHIGLGVKVISALHRQWNLQNVAVDHPVVKVIVDSQGRSNLPTFQSSGNQSSTNLWDLAIQHILLDRGAVYYNDRKTPLNADLQDLTFKANYDNTANGRYYGTISYRNGQLQYGSYAPLQHDLQADFDARRTGMTLSKVTLKSGNSQVLLNASLDNYSSPKLHADYVVLLATGDFRRVLRNPSLPLGVVLVKGLADYISVPGRPALDTSSLEGTVRSAVLRVNTPSVRTDVRDLAANYHLANGNAEVRDISARLLGGDLKGNAMVRNLSGKQQGQVNLALHNISMADVKTIANSATLKPVAVSGRINGNAAGSWTGTISNLQLRSNITVDGNIASAQANGTSGNIPLNAVIHARYNGAAQEIALNQSYVRTQQASIDLNGTISNRSALQVRVHSNDLHELETITEVFGQKPAQPLNLHGTASFDGAVRGSTKAPQIAGQLNASNLEIRGTTFRVVRTNLQANPSQVSLQNGDVELAKQGKLTFNVQSGLHDWSHTPNSPFTINVTASQLSVAELAHAANVTTPVTGTLNANIVAHGTQLNPIGQGEINLRNASFSGEPIRLANVHFQGTGDAVHTNLLIKIAAGTTQGQVTYYPKQEGYDAQLQAINIQLQQLQSLKQRNIQASGTLNLTASGRGTLKDPQGKASLTIPQLDVQKQQIRNVNLQAEVVNHQATFDLGSQMLNTPLKAQGKVALTGDYYADASFDTPVIQLQPLLAVYSPAQASRMNGQTEIHAALRGPLKNKQQMEAHVNIPTLTVTYQAQGANPSQPVLLQIAAVKPVRADYVNQVLSLQPGEIKGTGTDVRYQGQLPLGENAPSTLRVQGGVDLALVEAFDPSLTSGGRIQFDINAAGHKASENVEGVIRIVNASFATPDAPLGLSNANGVLTLRRDRVDITNFTGNVGGGTVTASGAVAYRPAIQFNIGVKGNDMRLLYPASVRTDLGMNLAMTGTTSAAFIQGQVNVNGVSFTPDFDLSTFISQFGGVAPPPPTQGFADNIRLNVAVHTPAQLEALSPTASIKGGASLRVIGTAADPVIVGRVNLTGGDMIFLGNRYVVEGGTIAFVNSTQTEPVVNLQVQTEVQQYKIAMRFRGPIDRLETSYTSDPALAQADIIHLLAFGSTEEAAAAAPSQSTTQSAEALVASQVSSQVTGRLEKALGVSQISLDPQLGATTANQQQGARLTVRQRATSKLYVTFSTDVTTTQFSAVQLQYRMNQKWSVSGVRDENGGFGLDGRYHKEF